MKPFDIKPTIYIELNKNNNKEGLKFVRTFYEKKIAKKKSKRVQS